MSNEEQVADTIEMLYERLNSYSKQDLFNYGYLLESNDLLRKGIEEKGKEIERLCNILDNIGYQIEGIIRKTEEFGISKNTGEVLSKHNIELLKEILKMIVNKDVSIRSDKE